MSKNKKISQEEFIKLVINKELEIANANITYDDIINDAKKPLEEQTLKHWYTDNSFKTVEQYLEWKQFFFNHFSDWQPKRNSTKTKIAKEFSWFNLLYGLKYDFDYNLIKVAEDERAKKKR